MVQAKKRTVGLSRVVGTPPLLKFVKHKPIQEPDSIYAPPLASSDEEEDDGVQVVVRKQTPLASRSSLSRKQPARQKYGVSALPAVVDISSDSDSDSDSDLGRGGRSQQADMTKMGFGNPNMGSGNTRESLDPALSPQIRSPKHQNSKRKRDSDDSSLSELGDSDIDSDAVFENRAPSKKTRVASPEPFSAFRKREAAKMARQQQVTYGKMGGGQVAPRQDYGRKGSLPKPLSKTYSKLAISSTTKDATTKLPRKDSSTTNGIAQQPAGRKQYGKSTQDDVALKSPPLNDPSSRQPIRKERTPSPEPDSASLAISGRGDDDRKRISETPRPILIHNDDVSDLSTPGLLSEEDALPASPPEAKCPMCGQDVDPKFLAEFSGGVRMRVSRQVQFCREHQKQTARKEWRYPDIDWTRLEGRLAGLRGLLVDIMDGCRTAPFADRFAENVKAGRNRTLLKTVGGVPVPGYYGPRGSSTISATLTRQLGSVLRKKAVEKRVISARGAAAYVEEVLMPEAAVRLIMEDMGVDEGEARKIMRESASAGELINEEVAQVVEDDGEEEEEASQRQPAVVASDSELSELDDNVSDGE